MPHDMAPISALSPAKPPACYVQYASATPARSPAAPPVRAPAARPPAGGRALRSPARVASRAASHVGALGSSILKDMSHGMGYKDEVEQVALKEAYRSGRREAKETNRDGSVAITSLKQQVY